MYSKAYSVCFYVGPNLFDYVYYCIFCSYCAITIGLCIAFIYYTLRLVLR